MKFKGIIFDLDGTLINTLDDIGHSMNDVLSEGGFPIHPIEDYKLMVGDGMTELARRALPSGTTDLQIEQSVKRMMEIYGKNYNLRSKVYGGILPLIEDLKTKNLSLGILTNKPHSMAVTIIQSHFPLSTFNPVEGAREGQPRKPDPTVALIMAKKWELKSHEVVFVGDSAVDMQTAQNAGMYGAGVLWGFRGKEELQRAGAKSIVKNPLELLEILK